jgi:hypothetical protein
MPDRHKRKRERRRLRAFCVKFCVERSRLAREEVLKALCWPIRNLDILFEPPWWWKEAFAFYACIVTYGIDPMTQED